MKPEEIKLDDWARIFLGEVPASFIIEVIIRAAFIFILIIFCMRLIGARMSSQTSRNELAALVSLAASIGVSIQAPDRGLLPTLAAGLTVVAVTKLVIKLSFKNPKVEKLVLDQISFLVKDSVLDLKEMKRSRITKERLIGQLRSEGFKHMGEVKRVYLEADGKFSIIKEEQEKPGLSLLPEWDKEFIESQFEFAKEVMVCKNCGKRSDTKPKRHECPNCKNKEWTRGVQNKDVYAYA